MFYLTPHTSDDALGILVLVLLPAGGLLFWLFNAWCMGRLKRQTRIPTPVRKCLSCAASCSCFFCWPGPPTRCRDRFSPIPVDFSTGMCYNKYSFFKQDGAPCALEQ